MKKIIKTFSLLIITLFSVLFVNINNSQITYADTTETTNIIETVDNIKNVNEKNNNDEKVTYIVQEGDTLWDIAYEFFGDPTLFGKIYDANLDLLSEPQLIYPGQELIINVTSNNSGQENNTEIKEEENIQQESQPEAQGEPQAESETEQEPQVEPGVEQEPQTEANVQGENNTINNENSTVTDENGFIFSKGEEDRVEEDTTVSKNNFNNSNSGKLTFVEDEDTNTEKGNDAVYNFLKQFNSMSPEKMATIFIFGVVGVLVLVLIIQIIFTLIPRKVKRKKVKLSRKEKKENKKNKKLKPSK